MQNQNPEETQPEIDGETDFALEDDTNTYMDMEFDMAPLQDYQVNVGDGPEIDAQTKHDRLYAKYRTGRSHGMNYVLAPKRKPKWHINRI